MKAVEPRTSEQAMHYRSNNKKPVASWNAVYEQGAKHDDCITYVTLVSSKVIHVLKRPSYLKMKPKADIAKTLLRPSLSES